MPPADAWSYVAGLTAGQDISERIVQLSGPAPQFSLGKSFPGFAPIGPWVVTVDEFDDPDDIELQCAIDGETVQHGRTKDFVFNVPALIEGLSTVTPLLPGDIIFCGTPAGVGQGRNPTVPAAPARSSSARSRASASCARRSSPPELRSRPPERRQRKRTAMPMHRLTSITIGVPNLRETAEYYHDFGLIPAKDEVFSAYAGEQPRRGRRVPLFHP